MLVKTDEHWSTPTWAMHWKKNMLISNLKLRKSPFSMAKNTQLRRVIPWRILGLGPQTFFSWNCRGKGFQVRENVCHQLVWCGCLTCPHFDLENCGFFSPKFSLTAKKTRHFWRALDGSNFKIQPTHFEGEKGWRLIYYQVIYSRIVKF